ncbi:MAG: phosphonopyruvate decarboxylase [Muribaculaceae bacterium]|nr:phosphonopyruvate decarboxylase [Muribaculaceae bacterium]
MVSPELFIRSLRENGVNFYAGVPDSLLKNVCAYITDNLPADRNIITANEGNAVGVAVGHYLATGEIPMVYMQNSGIGNAVNPLLSLADEKVYSIPLLIMIGWRGEPGVHDEPQHVKQGEVTLSLLDAMGIPYIVLPEEEGSAVKALERITKDCRNTSSPHAIIIRKGTFGSYKLKNTRTNDYPVSREEALKHVVDILPEDAVIVSTTGKLSRELYEYRDEKNQSHRADFLTVGSMGHSSSIALGIALAVPDRKVFCFDGDGAFLMHMGAISNIGNLAPENFIHIIFNNGAHESVGGQPTLGLDIDIPAIATACGYKSAVAVSTVEEIHTIIDRAITMDGPTLIEIKVGINSRENLGRPKSSPIENKEALMDFIRND